jgi:PAS domain S-box-containing protein
MRITRKLTGLGKGRAISSLPRWLLAAAVLGILAILGGGGWFYYTQRQFLRRDAGDNLHTIAQLKVDRIVQSGLILGLTLAAGGFGFLWQRSAKAHYRGLCLVEAALRTSQERYGSLFDNMAEGFARCRMVFDNGRPRDFTFLAVNPAFERLTGLRDAVGKKASELMPGIRESDPDLFEIYGRVVLSGHPEQFETFVTALNDWFSVSVYSPHKEHFVAVFSVITKRQRAEEALRASEVRYRRLFEAAKDGVLILEGETGMVVDVNPYLVQLLGCSRTTFLEKKIWELGFFKDIVADQANFELLRQAEYIRYDDRPLETADGRRIEVEFVSNAYVVNHRKVIQCNVRDVTERRRNEERARTHRRQLRALSGRIEKLREEERTRISREIHDELGQMLTCIKMDLRWMEHRLDDFRDDRRLNPILDKLVATAELAGATIKTVQRIAADLRPGILDNLGLPMALQYEAGRFEDERGNRPLRPQAWAGGLRNRPWTGRRSAGFQPVGNLRYPASGAWCRSSGIPFSA